MHRSAVQTFPSETQTVPVPPAQAPAPSQVVPLVHGLPSSQALAALALTFVLTQAPPEQASVVQGLPSSAQDIGVPLQLDPEQLSASVQGLPSLQTVPSVTTRVTQAFPEGQVL
jgi:hypothetical protein